MSLLSLIQSGEQKPTLQVFINGILRSNVVSAVSDSGFDVVSAKAVVVFDDQPDFTFTGTLVIKGGYSGLTATVFNGFIEDKEDRWFPHDRELQGSGQLKRAQYQYANGDLIYSSKTDDFVVKDLLSKSGIVGANIGQIDSAGVTLGTVDTDVNSTPVKTTCTLNQNRAPWELINEIDQCFCFKTFDTPSGQVVRRQILDVPNTAAVFLYAEDDPDYPILSLSGPETVSTIRNQVNITGYSDSEVNPAGTWPVSFNVLNPLVPTPPTYIAFEINSSLIESTDVAIANVGPNLSLIWNRVVQEVTIEVPGNPLIQPGDSIGITSKNGDCSGNYFVQHVTQELSNDTFITRLKCFGGSGIAGSVSPAASFQVTITKQVDGAAAIPDKPASPTSTTGTVAAGTYTYAYTYTNSTGETAASAVNTFVASGSNGYVFPTPLNDPDATGWNLYCSQAGGTSMTKQNGSPVSIGSSFTLSATPTNTGGAPPATGTSGTISYDVFVDGSNSRDPLFPSLSDLTFHYSNTAGVTGTTNGAYYSFVLTAAQLAAVPSVSLFVTDPNGATSITITTALDSTLFPDFNNPFVGPDGNVVINVAAKGHAECTADGGQTWNTWTPLTGHIISTPEQAVLAFYSLFGSDDGKLYLDVNNLSSAPVDISGSNFGSSPVNCVFINNELSSAVLVGLGNGELWLCTDASAKSTVWHWTKLFTFPSAVNWCVITGTAPFQLFVSTSNQMLSSIGGSSWSEGAGNGGDLGIGGACYRLSYFPVLENTFAGDIAGVGAVYRTDPTGATSGSAFTFPALTPAPAEIKGLTHNEDASIDAFYCGDDQARTFEGSTASLNLTQLGTLPGTPGSINHMVTVAITPPGPLLVLAAADKGVFKSVNDCVTWYALRGYDGTTLKGLMVGYADLAQAPVTHRWQLESGAPSDTINVPLSPFVDVITQKPTIKTFPIFNTTPPISNAVPSNWFFPSFNDSSWHTVTSADEATQTFRPSQDGNANLADWLGVWLSGTTFAESGSVHTRNLYRQAFTPPREAFTTATLLLNVVSFFHGTVTVYLNGAVWTTIVSRATGTDATHSRIGNPSFSGISIDLPVSLLVPGQSNLLALDIEWPDVASGVTDQTASWSILFS